MITTVLARITPTCKDVTHLASQAMDRPLPWLTRVDLQLHYWICEACARYRGQLRTVRQVLRRSIAPALDQNPKSSSPAPAVRARLTEAFRAKRE
ncbi:MAG TPA: zf-HC2 domain-containing protein [Nitrospiraceae bacterium]|nr:zf-HC2 domain-containing protein [Nitrospiraceae bacterium]